MQRIKKFILGPSVILFSVYFSLLFALGIILGYISTKLVHRKITRDWGVNSLKIKLGKFRLHFHHWLMGVSALLIFWWTGVLDFLPTIILGMFGGIIAQGIYDYPDWHRVIAKTNSQL